MTLADFLQGSNHHAYGLIGGGALHDELLAYLERKTGFKLQGNPDFIDRVYDSFTIDDARELKTAAGLKAVSATNRKIFVLKITGLTNEAQNALLKILEEPPAGTQFFLIVPSLAQLLPTVRSRLSLFAPALPEKGGGETAKQAAAFLKLSVAARLEAVKKLMEEIAKEKKSKQDALDFLEALEYEIYERGPSKQKEKLEAVEIARKYARDRSPSLKMLLEYVAMSL